MDTVSLIIKFENEGLPANELFELFGELIKTGQAWQLQGFYGRIAQKLIDKQLLSVTGEITEQGQAVLDEELED